MPNKEHHIANLPITMVLVCDQCHFPKKFWFLQNVSVLLTAFLHNLHDTCSGCASH